MMRGSQHGEETLSSFAGISADRIGDDALLWTRLAALQRTVAFSEWRVRTKPQAADASRDIIWQGNCDVFDQQLCGHTASSNTVSSRNTIAIEYPISNCPAKFGAASFLRLDPKRPGPRFVSLIDVCPPGRFRLSSNVNRPPGARGQTSLSGSEINSRRVFSVDYVRVVMRKHHLIISIADRVVHFPILGSNSWAVRAPLAVFNTRLPPAGCAPVAMLRHGSPVKFESLKVDLAFEHGEKATTFDL